LDTRCHESMKAMKAMKANERSVISERASCH
jgi:hypothetical protein